MTVLWALAPAVAVWSGSLLLAWITTPARRGTIARRQHDLKRPAPRWRSEEMLIDLSGPAAAYFFALRVGAAARGIANLLLVISVLLLPILPFGLIGLVCVIWIQSRWQRLAAITYFLIAEKPTIALTNSSYAYQFPSYRRGELRVLSESWVPEVFSIFGFALVLCAGLPLALHSDALVTGIPGLYIQHSGLAYWQIGVILFTVGGTLAWIGVRLERRIRRSSMRRETGLEPAPTDEDRPAVFLRPFGAENLMVASHPSARRDNISLLLPRRKEFLEDVVTWLLWSRGKVIAVAAPGGERDKTVGAAHHLLPGDQDWKVAVSRLLSRASAIVLIPGVTPGVDWERDQVLSNRDHADKALFVNPAPAASAEPFLTAVGASGEQAAELSRRRLRPLAATSTTHGPRLLCSTLGEDIDIEMAIDWFLQDQLSADHPAAEVLASMETRLETLRG